MTQYDRIGIATHRLSAYNCENVRCPMRFELNRRKLKELVAFRGWRSIYTPLAEQTGFSVSYCRRVVLGHEKLTEYFMLRYIQAAGCNPNRPAEWGSLFDVHLGGDLPAEHSPAWNYSKLNGQVPYKALSTSYEFRKQDNPDIEIEPISKFKF